MRQRIESAVRRYIKHGKAFEYIADAVELYDVAGDRLKRIYPIIAKKYGVNASAVERSVSLAVSNIDTDVETTPKEFIAQIKERIMFEIDE